MNGWMGIHRYLHIYIGTYIPTELIINMDNVETITYEVYLTSKPKLSDRIGFSNVSIIDTFQPITRYENIKIKIT